MAGARNDRRVLVVRCERYDRGDIERLVTEGMRALGFRPRGKVFVKPNVVFAGDPDVFGTHAYTNPVLTEACAVALSQAGDASRIDIGEKCAVGFPTRHCYRHAGYYDAVARARKRAACPVDLHCMDEDLRDTVFVGGRVHDTLRLSRRLTRADVKVYLPKLKCHCVSNMTGAVKLNVGICSDDDRSIRHDFLLNEKIVDLLSVGWPDFVVMDAIEVGVGNEAFPHPRKLGLLIMGTNPVAVDLVGARLLGFALDDVAYLRAAVDRGYEPSSIDEVVLEGDITSLEALDEQAKRVMPYDDAFTAWHDVQHELERLHSPMRFHWGPYHAGKDDLCKTGCVMALKMFLASYERFSGPEAFTHAKPVTFVIGRSEEVIDGGGHDVFLVGSCAKAEVRNARAVVRIEKCFTTTSDLTMHIGHRLGMPSPMARPSMSLPLVGDMVRAAWRKTLGLRYGQDVARFATKHLIRRV